MPRESSDQTVPDGEGGCLGARAGAELAEDAADVVLDGTRAEREERGNLWAGSPREQTKNLTLTACQAEDVVLVRLLDVTLGKSNRVDCDLGDDLKGRRRPTGSTCSLERCLG